MHLRRPFIDKKSDMPKKSSLNWGEWAMPSSKILSNPASMWEWTQSVISPPIFQKQLFAKASLHM